MNKTQPKKWFLLSSVFLFSILVSCKEIINKVAQQDWTTVEISDPVEGTYHNLQKVGLKIFLPQDFKRYNIMQYKELLDTIAKPDLVRKEIKRLEMLRDDVKGDFYLYYDGKYSSTYILNTLPYADFNRNDAEFILGIIHRSQNVYGEQNTNYEKITASFRATDDVKIFRAIFKITNSEKDFAYYNTIYMVSTSTKKTFQIILTTPFEVNFDPFIQKIKI